MIHVMERTVYGEINPNNVTVNIGDHTAWVTAKGAVLENLISVPYKYQEHGADKIASLIYEYEQSSKLLDVNLKTGI